MPSAIWAPAVIRKQENRERKLPVSFVQENPDGFMICSSFGSVRRIFHDICDAAVQCIADSVQHIGVISFDFVFVVIIDHLVLDPGSLCKLISADIFRFQHAVKL